MSPGPATEEPPTTPPPFCSEGYVNIVYTNYSSNRSIYGTEQRTTDVRFEVCIGDRFTSVCDIGWDNRDAEVVCRDSGFYMNTGTYVIWIYGCLFEGCI